MNTLLEKNGNGCELSVQATDMFVEKNATNIQRRFMLTRIKQKKQKQKITFKQTYRKHLF